MTQPVLYPVMQGHLHQHGINVHFVEAVSDKVKAIRNSGIHFVEYEHYAFCRPNARTGLAASMAAYVDQVEAVMPTVRLCRPIWNLHSFDANGAFVSTFGALFKEMARRGWRFLLCMFDGPSQRGWSWRAGRSPQATMDGWARRHAYGWTRLMDWFAAEGLLGAIYGIEPLNEPDAYNQMENSGLVSSSRAIWYYTEHNKRIWDIVRARTTAPELVMSGWRWNGSMGPLSRVPIPEYGGKTAIEHLAAHYPDKTLIGSLHTGAEDYGDGTPRDYLNRFSPSDLDSYADWRFRPTRLIASEILNVRDNAVHMVPIVEPEQTLQMKNLDHWHYYSMMHWWWPVSNVSRSRLFDTGAASIRDFYRHSITAFTAMCCYPQRAEWFKGPQQGIKDEASPDTITITQTDPYDKADIERIWAAAEPLPPDSQRFSRYFGGKGTTVVNVAAGRMNSVFGGDGWTVVNGTDSSWEIVYLGRGGGVVRCGAGLNIVTTRWGTARVFTGPGHNAVFCFTAATVFSGINALRHETTVIIDPRGTHYLHDWHRAEHKISFMGAFKDADALRAAARFIPSSLPSKWSHDLWIDLPGGGSVRMAHGVACMERLVTHCRDFADGWYRPGWSEPADYSPAALTAPLVDPSPAMDALYVWGDGAGSGVFDWDGNEVPMFDWDGAGLAVALWE